MSAAKTENSSSGQTEEAQNNVTDDDDDDDDDDDSLAKQLQARAPRIITHLNRHHPDSVQAYALAFGTPPLPASLKIGTCQITKVDLYGFTIQVTTDGIKQDSWYVFCPYSRPLQAASEVHAISIEMHIQAYDKLGYAYKLQHGYYSRMITMIGSKVVQTAKKKLLVVSSSSSTSSSLWTRHRLLSVAACTGLLLAASAWLWHYSSWSRSSSKTGTSIMPLLSPAREQQPSKSTAAGPAPPGPIGIPKRPVYIERP